jgi:hypothetical protein
METGEPIVGRLYAQAGEIDSDCWEPQDGDALVNMRVPLGKHSMRLVSLVDDRARYFSDVIEVEVRQGETRKFHLALNRGRSLPGRLDERVPRPIRNGEVYCTLLTGEKLQWDTWTEIREDGTFEFENLPNGSIELHAICDGFVSENGRAENGRETTHGRSRQAFSQGQDCDIKMEPTGRLQVRVIDEKGLPVSGVIVSCSPNIVWPNGSSRLFSHPISTEERIRQTRQQRATGQFSKQPTIMWRVQSDENGLAVLTNLPPGKVPFSAFGREYRSIDHGEANVIGGKMVEAAIVVQRSAVG